MSPCLVSKHFEKGSVVYMRKPLVVPVGNVSLMYPNSKEGHTNSQISMVLVESYEIHRHGVWEQKGNHVSSNGYHRRAALDEKDEIRGASRVSSLAQGHCAKNGVAGIYTVLFL